MFSKQLFRNVFAFLFNLLYNLTYNALKLLENIVFKIGRLIREKEWDKPKKTPETVSQILSAAFESDRAFRQEFDKYMNEVLRIKPECEKYWELLYYNFSLRYFIAYYESRFDKIPLQVYNEYRMTFDHFMRFFIDEKEGSDWSRALSHARRGVLDILKLNCFWLQEIISQKHKSVPFKAFGLDFEGKYIRDYSELQASAEFALWEAKRKEIEICDDKDKNISVIDNFIVAFLAHLRWDEYQRRNAGKIAKMKIKYIALFAFKFVGILAIIKVAIDDFGLGDFIMGFLLKIF